MGKIFGDKWERKESIGQGGQSYVYACVNRDDPDEKLYALKRVKNDKKLDRVSKEIKTRKNNKIEYVPKIEFSDLESEEPYFIEEYISGGTLRKNIDSFKNNISKTLSVFIQICQIVADAHSKGIIHRDIKPDNLLYNIENDKYYLTDFGICFVEGEGRFTETAERVGPRDFMAPELERGRLEDVTEACDVYSLGKVLYYMLRSDILYREHYRRKSYNLIMVFNENQYERINRIFDKSIQYRPDDRYQSVRDMIKDVQQAQRLIELNKGLVSYGLGSDCMFCGKGRYISHAYYDPQKHNSEKYSAKQTEFKDLGIDISKLQSKKCHILICNHCGNFQFFVRGDHSDSWEEPSDIVLND